MFRGFLSRVTSCHFDKQQRLRGYYMWGTRLHTIFLKMHGEYTVYIMDIFLLYKLDVLPTFLVYYFTICLPPAVPSLVDVSWLSKCIYGQPKTGCEQCSYCSSAFAPKWPQKQSQSVSWVFKNFMGGMPSDPPNLACLCMYTYTPDNHVPSGYGPDHAR